MKMKNLIKISGVVICAAALFLNVSINGKNSSGKIDMATITISNQADAECTQTNDPYRDTGRCSALSGNCYWGGTDCDWTQ